MKRLLLPLILLTTSQALSAQDAFSTLEERMTGKEFSAAGLDKLSNEELAALNAWLRSHSVATLQNARYAEGVATEDTLGFKNKAAPESDQKVIVSTIMGSFSGWKGVGAEIKLDNGMTWKTAEQGNFYIPPREGAVATIKKGIFGTWRLEVEGYNKTVRVERVE